MVVRLNTRNSMVFLPVAPLILFLFEDGFEILLEGGVDVLERHDKTQICCYKFEVCIVVVHGNAKQQIFDATTLP